MFKIIIDTREQNPLSFNNKYVEGTVNQKLDTGDYSIQGLENLLCIERKGSVSEFYSNVTEKRFWAELERMQEYKYRFLVFEFSVSDVEMFPHGSDLPKKVISQLKISPTYLMKCIGKIQVDYGVHVVFGQNRDNCTYLITDIMKAVYEFEQ